MPLEPLHFVWHRGELRTHDNPALAGALWAAETEGGRVVPVVVIDANIFARPDLTPRRRAWFLENVRALRKSYESLGAGLLVREGEPAGVLAALVQEARAAGFAPASLHTIRNYTPYAKTRDRHVTKALRSLGLRVVPHGGQFAREPGIVITNEGGRYGVYSAYRRKWETLPLPDLAQAPDHMASLPPALPKGEIPRVEPGIPLPPNGEWNALDRLEKFQEELETGYAESRNDPALEYATSRLAYYFNLGVLSPRLATHRARDPKWRAELVWRDFFADVLDRVPESATAEYNPAWRGFPWRQDPSDLERWTAGQTGYPIVDAGMRELQSTGFMHNRVRMICASFLTKHLLLDWRLGERVFRGLLLCGDTAQNVGNWQWTAGCGVDAAPYFRIFNPVSQGQKFDPQGVYVRRWVPELGDVPEKFIHTPWDAPLLAPDYPERMIGLAEGRDRFLEVAKGFLGRGT